MTMTRDIAGITAALQRLLEGFLPKVDLAGTPAAIGVSALPPDRIGLTPEHNGLNLYLYRITTSSAQRTEEMSLLWQMFGEKYRPSIPFTAAGLVLRAADAAPVVTPSP